MDPSQASAPVSDDTATGQAADDPRTASQPEPDYADDAGADLQQFDYPDDPEPAESIVGTLCNLNQTHFEGLRVTRDGEPVVDDNLRTVLVGLSDLLGAWETLRNHYPDSVPDIDTAREIYELWDEAVLNVDNGDLDAAQTAMDEAESLLEELPDGPSSDCTT